MNTQIAPPTDGRSARRERGRLAVLDAAIDLIAETGTAPITATIAERAGVSPATLFRYFDSADDLMHEATLHHFERNREFFGIPRIGEGSLEERIDRLAAARVTLHHRVAPVARFGRSRAIDVPYIADGIRSVRRLHAKQTREHFASEFAGMDTGVVEDLVMNVVTLTSFESWDQQRTDFNRSNRQIQQGWVVALRALLHAG